MSILRPNSDGWRDIPSPVCDCRFIEEDGGHTADDHDENGCTHRYIVKPDGPEYRREWVQCECTRSREEVLYREITMLRAERDKARAK